MTLLDTAGLCVLVFACLLYCFEKMIFEYDCYCIIFDTGSMLCSCISSILLSSCRPYYDYRLCQRCWPRRCTRNYYPSSWHHPLDSKRNKSVFTTDGDNTDNFETNMAQEQNALECTRSLVLQLNNQHLIQVHHQASDLSLPGFYPSSYFLKSAVLN